MSACNLYKLTFTTLLLLILGDTTFPGGLAVKNPPIMQQTQVWSLGQEDPLEKEVATHSSILCLGNPMDGAACWVAGSERVGHNWITDHDEHEVLGTQCVFYFTVRACSNSYDKFSLDAFYLYLEFIKFRDEKVKLYETFSLKKKFSRWFEVLSSHTWLD